MQEIAHPEKVTEAERAFPYRNRDQLRFLIVCGAFCGDIVAIGIAALIASWLRFGEVVSGNTLDLLGVVLFPYVLAALVLEAFRIEHLRKRATSIRRAVTAFMVAFGVAVIAAFAFKVSATYSRLETGYLVALATIGLILWRFAYSSIVNRWFAAIAEPVVIVLGDSSSLADERLRDGTAEVIDVDKRGWKPGYNDPDFLDRLAKEVGPADRVVLAFGDDQARHDWIALAQIKGLDAEVWQPNLLATPALGLNELNGASTLIVSRGPLQLHERVVKRIFDLGLTIPGLIFLSPVMVLLAILIKLESPGPVIFVQKRIGIKNRFFNCYKFRTMYNDLRDENAERLTSRNDERITRFGSIMRRWSLDELPQLLNVIKGEMSLIGPRPHALSAKAEGRLYHQVVAQYLSRHMIKPGITGLAQVSGWRGETDTEEKIINRVDCDIQYINNWSLFMDIKILARTFVTVFRGKKAF